METVHHKLISTFALLVLASACTPMEFRQADVQANGKTEVPSTPSTPTTPTTPTSPTATPAPRATKSDSFLQDDTAGKVDIMVIDDNSRSMEVEQTKMSLRFPSFISSLADLDYQLSMTTTDVDSAGQSNLSGRVLNWTGTTSKILTPRTPSASDIFRASIKRSETIGCGDRGDCPSGNEQPLKATILAIQKRLTDNAGVFRDGVDLAVVVLSDEDELSNGPSNATTPQAVVDAFKLQFGDTKRLRVFGIVIKSGDKICKALQLAQTNDGQSAYYATHVEELARLTGGSTNSICDLDYSKSLSDISASVRKLIGTFELSAAPDVKTLKVTLTPARAIAYHVEGKNLIFDTPPPAGTQIDVSYSTP